MVNIMKNKYVRNTAAGLTGLAMMAGMASTAYANNMTPADISESVLPYTEQVPKAWVAKENKRLAHYNEICKDAKSPVAQKEFQDLKHTVQPGESLSKIVQDAYMKTNPDSTFTACNAYQLVKDQYKSGKLLVNGETPEHINRIYPKDVISAKIPVLGYKAPVKEVITPQKTQKTAYVEPVIDRAGIEQQDSEVWQYVAEQADISAPGVKLQNHLSTRDYNRADLGERVQEDFDNAERNMKNAGHGLLNLIGGILELPGDIVNGLTWGLVPSYDITAKGIVKDATKPQGNIASKIFYPVGKIIGDGIGEPIDGALDGAQGVVFSGVNVLQVIPDVTIGNVKHGRTVSDGIFNTAYIGADYAVNVIPFGDASQRVHSMDLNKGLKGAPFVNNLYTDTHVESHGGEQTEIQNTGFRKTIETIGSGIMDVVTFNWLNKAFKNKGSTTRTPPPENNGGLLGNQLGGGAF